MYQVRQWQAIMLWGSVNRRLIIWSIE